MISTVKWEPKLRPIDNDELFVLWGFEPSNFVIVKY